MTKKEKVKIIVWTCIGVATLTAILLFFLLPRRGDKLLKLPDVSEVHGLFMVDSSVSPYGPPATSTTSTVPPGTPSWCGSITTC